MSRIFLPFIQGRTVSQDLFLKVMEFVSRWEGGFVNHPDDPGGATNMGITIGTLTRWRKMHYRPTPTVEDVRNLTRDEANAIYHAFYWGPSGASQVEDYPTALLLMDSAVLHGVGAAQAWVADYGYNPWKIAARRMRVYTGSTNWATFGKGWTNRVAALLEEMGRA